MPHELWELKQKQSLPFQAKVYMSIARIRQWYDAFDGNVYVSFSGGKDSTVLLHLVRSIYPDVPAVYVDTGLEYPEIKAFVKTFDNVTILRPEMNFRQVIEKYGYPIISKDVAMKVHYARMGSDWALKCFEGVNKDGTPSVWRKEHYTRWKFLIDAPFDISSSCCDVMKKRPIHKYNKETGLKPFLGTLASESAQRQQAWLQTGCNAFDSAHQHSSPLSFWLEQDVLQYIKTNNLQIASVYGEVQEKDGKLFTTGLNRTGCMFCMFGAHLEKCPNRFQKMAHTHTHPSIYEYCLKPKEEHGLGLKEVLDYLKIPY